MMSFFTFLLLSVILNEPYPASFKINEAVPLSVINGVTEGGLTGHSVSGGKDINGDGISDILIGSNNIYVNQEFGAFVVFGQTGVIENNFTVDDLDGENGFKLKTNEVGDGLGFAVGFLDDINADGIDDFIVGAHAAQGNKGKSYVVFGSQLPFAQVLNLDSLDGTNGFIINGLDEEGHLGFSVSSAGDFNADGFNDLLVGAYLSEEAGPEQGSVYIIFGSDSGFSKEVDLSQFNGTNGLKIQGESAGDHLGGSIGSVGDFNGDSIDDIILGAILNERNGIKAGSVYILFGSSLGFSPEIDLTTLDGNNGIKISGESSHDRFGYKVLSAGDIDLDGQNDVLIGAIGASSLGVSPGAVYVVLGQNSFAQSTFILPVDEGLKSLKITGEFNSMDFYGWPVASGFDINADGVDDFAFGVPFANEGHVKSNGKLYVVFGAESLSQQTEINVSNLNGNNGFVVSGVARNDEFGVSIHSSFDANGDGLDDIVIGARGMNQIGGAYILPANDGIFSSGFN